MNPIEIEPVLVTYPLSVIRPLKRFILMGTVLLFAIPADLQRLVGLRRERNRHRSFILVRISDPAILISDQALA